MSLQNNPKYKMITPEQTAYQAEVFSNRVVRQYKHLRKRFARANIDCFRLYDWDIPEVRAVVDWYAGHLVVGEYVRQQAGPEWLPQMAKAAGIALGISPEKIHVKKRQTNTKNKARYLRLDQKEKKFTVNERELKFWVNLDDFLDTGLFSDHRDTRIIIKDSARGQDFLNLFAYTGAFTCAAALGGAKTTVTVDRSETYLQWAGENFRLNNLAGANHSLVQSDINQFLAKAVRDKKRYTLAVVDPPSFFRDQSRNIAFDINKDHPDLLRKVIQVMKTGGKIYFSTNHQRFEPRFEGLPFKNMNELTPKTIPEDYRNRKIHHCWQIQV